MQRRLSIQREDLAGIENALWVQAFLDLAHDVDGAAKFAFEEFLLALADAVLAGAGAVHGECAGIEALDEGLGDGDLGGVPVIDDNPAVEIAVSRMADDRADQAR